jgi:transcription initiation factor TFIIIB Brf1 subunit/transcription initiation factor TFIIB
VSTVNIFRRISTEEISAAAHTIWKNKPLADKIAQDAIQIIDQTHKKRFAFYNGKTSKGLVGGLFYLLGHRYKAVKHQRELAWRLGTSDVTIRASYRQWLQTFPDVFPDVIEAFAEDKELKYFVLLNLKQKPTVT